MPTLYTFVTCPFQDSDASEGNLQTFSRSQHLEGVGLDHVLPDMHSVSTGSKQSDDGGIPPLAWQEGSASIPEGFSNESGGGQGEIVISEREGLLTDFSGEVVVEEFQVDAATEEAKWQQFKSEFTDILQSSEHHMEEEEAQRSRQEEGARAMRQQLLIDAITAMHSAAGRQTESKQNQEHLETQSTENHSDMNGVVHVKPSGTGVLPASTNAQPHRQRDILSISRLETICESDLDRMLEQVESEAQSRAARGESPIVQRNRQKGAPPTLPIVHTSAESGNALLMKGLEELNQKQLEVTVSVGTSTFSDTTTTQRGILQYIIKCNKSGRKCI